MVTRQAPTYRILRQVDLCKGTFDSAIWVAEERATGAVDVVVVIESEDGALFSRAVHTGPTRADWFVDALLRSVQGAAGWTVDSDLRREQLLAERGQSRVGAEEQYLSDLRAFADSTPQRLAAS